MAECAEPSTVSFRPALAAGLAEAILRNRRIAYVLADPSLHIEAIGDPFGLFAGIEPARPGASLVDLAPELVGSEEILENLDRLPAARLELDFVNRRGLNGDTVYWKVVALPRPQTAQGTGGPILLVEDVSELGALQQRLTQNYNDLLLLQRELALKNLQLAAANAELNGLAEMKSTFVSVAAHELKTPLSVILGYTDVLLTDPAERLTASQRESLEIVRKSSVHLLEITSNLLDLTRIELGRLELFLQPLALAPLVQAVLRELRPQLDAASQRIDLSMDPGLPLVLADEARAFQILRNILGNAHKYTLAGGSISIHLSRAATADELLIEVADTGVGIPAEDQPKLFRRFFRASNAGQAGVAGTGLGLYITRWLVELHGGRIWLESLLGEGTTVYVTLPVAEE